MTNRQRRKLKYVVGATVSVMVATVLVGFLVAKINATEFTIQVFYLAASSGAIVGLFLSAMEFYYIPGSWGMWIRKSPFLKALLFRTAISSVLIFAGLVIANRIFAPGRFLDGGFSIIVRDIIVLFGIFFVFFFVVQVRRIIGGRVLANFIAGRYHRPVEENRIFMFLDITGSTTLSQQLGDIGVYEMIKSFFFDIAEPIADFEGETHRYIGDEVVVTWPLEIERDKNRRCLDCYFAIKDKMDGVAADYKERFGDVLEYRVGLHGGTLVAGECGDEKQEIVYFGDTINTTARIQSACKAYDKSLLISIDLLKNISLPENYSVENLGPAELRGRNESLDIATVNRSE